MTDYKTLKMYMDVIFKMKEDFDVFLKDTKSFDDGRRCYAIYQFVYQLLMNSDYDVKVTGFNTSGHKIFIKTLINDGKFAVCVDTIRKPTKREISDLVHIVIYEHPSGRNIADFSFDTTTLNEYGMPFACTIGCMTHIDSEKHQVFSDVALAITKTIDWYICGE